MYSGSYEMPNCNACGREITPGELAEKFNCRRCSEKVWRCEGCKGKSKKYKCGSCGFEAK